jgi:hypothetical protein
MTDNNLHPIFRQIIEAHTGGAEPRKDLTLAGHATNQIWIMEDGPESHPIGIRLDEGDSGAVYLSRAQGRELAAQLLKSCGEI